jgi:CubicO group peptidase (beta-lactamase class C family)
MTSTLQNQPVQTMLIPIKRTLLSLFLFLFSSFGFSQTLYFPPLTGSNWDTLSNQELGWCNDSLQSLIDYVGDNNSKAFIILKDGKIALEKYYGTFTKDSLWFWASAGKSLTAFLVGMAQEEGLLSIDDLSSNYLGAGWTSCSSEQESLIRVRNQLTMTSGLNDDFVNPDCTSDTCLEFLADAGSRWAYHNAPYTLLDGVILGASGSTINQFYNSRVRNRIGMGTSAFIPTGDNNVMYSTARAMARFGLMILNRGVWNQDTLMHDVNYFDAMLNSSQSLNPSYGYLWWLNGKSSFLLPGSQISFPGWLLPEAPADLVSGVGKFCQYVNVVPSMNLVLVRMGMDPNGVGSLVPTVLNDEIWRRLNNIQCSITQVHTNDKFISAIYPNPTSDFLKIQLETKEEKLEYQLFDMQGRQIDSGNSSTINVQHLHAGIYLLKITTPQGISNHTISIQH